MTDAKATLDLIEQYSTLREFGNFLAGHGVAKSGSWSDLKDRALQAIGRRKLSPEALSEFLGEQEEYGRQHVFLFRSAGMRTSTLTEQQIDRWLSAQGAQRKVDEVLVLPEEPTIAEVRRDVAVNGDVLTIKIIETRLYMKLLATHEHDGNRVTREYLREHVRAINVIRLHPDGLVELRVFSHRNGSGTYAAELAQLWTLLIGLVDPTAATPLSLVRAKNRLYAERHSLEGIISFSGTVLRNSVGISVSAACGRERNLFDDEYTDDGLETMTTKGHAYHDELNVWWLKQKKGRPSEDIHVLLSGDSNEFAVTQHCSRGDYEHILTEIRRFNR